jgi:hypothetical protein
LNDERYVKRGRELLARAWLRRWRYELKRVNHGRRGRPFVLPPAMAPVVQRMLVSMRLSWRALEGVLSALLPVKAPDFTTIWKRLSREEAEPVVPPRSAIVAIDSTGFSSTVRGEWLRDHWRKRRGFMKAHVAIDVASLDVLAVVVTGDSVHDAEAFVPLVQQVLDRGVMIRRVLADGAYDSRKNFDLLRRHGIEGGIKVRKNASMRSGGVSFARPLAVRERNFLGAWLWERRYAYSLRWMIEYVFSAVKRTLGAEVRSRDRDLMFLEVENKFWTWNAMRAEGLFN